MELEVLITCVLIFLARVADVSMGTLRTAWIVQGRRTLAFFLGFFEVLIWLVAVSSVIRNISDNWWYAIFYALGFATGNYVGITLEQKLAYGEQTVRIFTQMGREMADAFRAAGFGVTVFRGQGRDSEVDMCFIETRRRAVGRLLAQARLMDPQCYYIVDDVQVASTAPSRRAPSSPTGWRAIRKKK
ncbi:MAG: hypothetical protein JSV91_10280 [Phycisphaerales bacterium]|nr:MAG: hypothetical protein JSV91_10280 [Phycisphaerales bacterium]